MAGLLPGLVKDLKRLVRTIPVGDSFTLGWFSGVGQFRFPIKGFKVSRDPEDEKVLDNLLDSVMQPLGLTCFSEVLQSAIGVVEDLAVFGYPRLNFCFFTDGYPCPETAKELSLIADHTKALGKVTTTSLVVGCGQYYNKGLLASMATNLCASLVHLDGLESLSSVTDQFVNQSSSGGVKVAVRPPVMLNAQSIGYVITDDQVVLLPQENGELLVPVPDTGDSRPEVAEFFLITDSGLVPDLPPTKGSEQALYAAAFVLVQQARLDQALGILSTLGDVALVEKVANSYTLDEIGLLEEAILSAVFDPELRFKSGKRPDCLPPEDAFCVLDLVKILAADSNAVFLPCHPWFKYKRIGAASQGQHEGAVFTPDPKSEARFHHLVWHSSRLNLSVRSLITGSVSLPDMRKALGTDSYPTFKHRVYTLVKDGYLNVSKLPVRLSEETFVHLHARGILEPRVDQNGSVMHSEVLPYDEDFVYLLNMGSLPVINRRISGGYKSASELGKLTLEELKLKSIVKMGKFLTGKDSVQPGVTSGIYLTPTQQEYLVKNFITSAGYTPKTTNAPTTDYYLATEFEIGVKGLSALPSANSIEKKVKAGTRLSFADQFTIKSVTDAFPGVEPLLHKRLGSVAGQVDLKESACWGQLMINSAKDRLTEVTARLQEAKFSIVLGKRWFEEFRSYEDCVLGVEGHQLSFELTKAPVHF